MHSGFIVLFFPPTCFKLSNQNGIRSSEWICSQRKKRLRLHWRERKYNENRISDLCCCSTTTSIFIVCISNIKLESTFSPNQTTANILDKWHFEMMQFEPLLMFSLATITSHKQHLSSKVPINYIETRWRHAWVISVPKGHLLFHTSLLGFAWRSPNTRNRATWGASHSDATEASRASWR